MVQSPPTDPQSRDRRTVLIVSGAVLALVAGVAIAWLLVGGGRGKQAFPPPAAQSGLVIDSSALEEGGLDAARLLRCFVAGQPVGELTLAECARRNGVATDALDVGLDQSGVLAAAEQAGTVLTPLPPAVEAPAEATPEEAPIVEAPVKPAVQRGSSGACWRYADSQWRKLPADMSLSSCLQALFAGRCERPGSATYGRWSQQTLRLVPGRVEISGDNRSFRTLVEQAPGCALPNIG